MNFIYTKENISLAMTQLLPPELQADVVILLQEWAWPAESAFKLVEWSAENGWPVVGLEVWHRVGDFPKWIATFSCPRTDGDRFVRARTCAALAEASMHTFESDQLAIFNIMLDFDEYEL